MATTHLEFHRLDDDENGNTRYSIIRDDKMGPCGYLHVDAGALEIVPLMASAPLLLNALRECLPFVVGQGSAHAYQAAIDATQKAGG